MLLHDLTPAHLCSSIACTLPTYFLAPTTLTFLFLKHTMFHSTTGPLYQLFLLLERPLPSFVHGWLLFILGPQLRWLFLMTPLQVLAPSLDITPLPNALLVSPPWCASLSEIILFPHVFTLEVTIWPPTGQWWPINVLCLAGGV